MDPAPAARDPRGRPARAVATSASSTVWVAVARPRDAGGREVASPVAAFSDQRVALGWMRRSPVSLYLVRVPLDDPPAADTVQR